jgi:hypothetical protein
VEGQLVHQQNGVGDTYGELRWIDTSNQDVFDVQHVLVSDTYMTASYWRIVTLN